MTSELTGYSDRWSVEPGSDVSFMVSADAAEVEATVVRLYHGDEHPDAPGLVEVEVDRPFDRPIAGGLKTVSAGSYVVGPPVARLRAEDLRVGVWAWPTRHSEREQALLSLVDPEGRGWSIVLADGRVELIVAGDGAAARIAGPVLHLRQWTRVVADVAPGAGYARLAVTTERGAGRVETTSETRALDGLRWAGDWPLVLAARTVGGPPEDPRVGDHFDGKLDSPWACVASGGAEPWTAGAPALEGALVAWDLGRCESSTQAVDVGPHGWHGRVVNAPARRMTGPSWTGASLDPRPEPAAWSAIHFHADDLDDAGWPVAATWRVPADTPSGIYALGIRADDRADHLPFVVRPPLGAPTSDVALLLPTFTYLAYANERMLSASLVDQLVAGDASAIEPHEADRLLQRHPEWGLSVYDRHADGSGCCHSSRLRPIPNVRPGYRFWSTGGPERFAADLYLTHFLRAEGVEPDVITDEDLHVDGRALLDPYRVVITGTHPEYWTERMLDALEEHLGRGGRLMYLGGNGFYWVTSVDPERPHLIEVRRGINGTRAWTSEPGETHHGTTGEPGGLWRYRGRDPNRLVGVGFASQSDSWERAAGYVRCPDSDDPRVAFIFDGVGRDEVIGDFGLINGGAAGYEIDRHDPALGAPVDVLRLATSAGRHGPSYLLAVEDVEFTRLDVTGPTSALVRADMTYMPYPNGGAVFSVGSCNWCASLSANAYDNNVARITRNVLAGFRGAAHTNHEEGREDDARH